MTETPGTGRQTISEMDLHGYIDGELPAQRRVEVETYLATHPDHAARLAEFSALTLALHRLYGGGQPANPGIDALTTDLDRALRRRHMAHRLFRIVAAMLALAAGIGAVSSLHDRFRQTENRFLAFTQQATNAHVLFAGDAPIPSGAEQGEGTEVVTWLSQRLMGVPLRAPDLRSLGYELSVERILPSAGGPAAQLMYESREAEGPVTLFIGKGKDNKATAFTYVQNDDLSVFYWQEGPFAYSLAGNIGKSELLTLAEEVNAQIVALPPVPKSFVQRRIQSADEPAAVLKAVRDRNAVVPAAAPALPSSSDGAIMRPVSSDLGAPESGIVSGPATKPSGNAAKGGASGIKTPAAPVAPIPAVEGAAPKKT